MILAVKCTLSDECLNCLVLRIFQETCQIMVFHVLNLANNQIQQQQEEQQPSLLVLSKLG
jgi:hypothetical protein